MTRKKRVLQLNLNGEGGAFSLIYQLQKRLSKGYIFDYYSPGSFIHNSKYYEMKKIGSKIYEQRIIANKVFQFLILPFNFYSFLNKHKYDIVHINGDAAYKILLYALPAHKAGVSKIIVHSHSSSVNGKYKTIKKSLHYLCRPFLLKNANIFLKCSFLAGKWMFNDKVNSVKLNNGVDLEKFKFDFKTRNKIRTKLNVNNRILLGTVGDYSYAKNPEYFIKILKALPKKYIMLFIGDGPNRQIIENSAKTSDVYKRCIFYGKTNHVEKMLNAMDIFLMTSNFEGLPVSAAEAQANGLPTFLSNKITSEVKLLPNCKMLPISDNDVLKWTIAIKSTDLKSQRKKAGIIVKEKGFDINDTANYLSKIYRA